MEIKQFQSINTQRALTWHKGGLQEWSLLEWAGAAAGELGEAANIAKKIRRMDMEINSNNNISTREKAVEMLGDEIADTITYMFLLASAAGIDVESAMIRKFNAISKRENLPFDIEP